MISTLLGNEKAVDKGESSENKTLVVPSSLPTKVADYEWVFDALSAAKESVVKELRGIENNFVEVRFRRKF